MPRHHQQGQMLERKIQQRKASLCSTDLSAISRITERDSRLMKSLKLERTSSNDFTSLETRSDSRIPRVPSSNLHRNEWCLYNLRRKTATIEIEMEPIRVREREARVTFGVRLGIERGKSGDRLWRWTCFGEMAGWGF